VNYEAKQIYSTGRIARRSILITHVKNGIFWPIIGGVIVFLVSQYLLQLVLEPLNSFRRILVSISNSILFHQAAISNGHADGEVSIELKRFAASLRAAASGIPFYGLLSTLRIFDIPARTNVNKGARELNGLSHGMNERSQKASPETNWAEENTKAMERIGRLLGIDTNYGN
jgi:hypothetical protein